jgi:hypothetical protein
MIDDINYSNYNSSKTETSSDSNIDVITISKEIEEIANCYAINIGHSKEITEKIMKLLSEFRKSQINQEGGNESSSKLKIIADIQNDFKTLQGPFVIALNNVLREYYSKKIKFSNAAKIDISSTTTQENKLVGELGMSTSSRSVSFANSVFDALEICDKTSRNKKSLQDIWREVENNA